MQPYPEDEQIQYLAARLAGRYPQPFNLPRFSGLWRDLAEVTGDLSGDAAWQEVDQWLLRHPQFRWAPRHLMQAPPYPPKPQVLAPPLPGEAQLAAGLAEGASPWLEQYVTFSRHWSPRAYDGFHQAVGLWLLSTVAARRVVTTFGADRFTPLLIALTARTSLYAKSTTASIGRDVLHAAGLGWLLAPDETTPQKMVQLLAGASVPRGYQLMPPAMQERARKRLALAGQQGWYYEEFGEKVQAILREGGVMAEFRSLLRRFDDCPPQYQYSTISRGDDTIQQPYLALLASMTPADLRVAAARGATLWGDGFWARFVFVTPPAGSEGARAFPEGERKIPPDLVIPLREWHERLGMPLLRMEKKGDDYRLERGPLPRHTCVMGEGVRAALVRYGEAMRQLTIARDSTDLDGNYTRLPEKALRVAALVASLENEGRIEMRHWALAQGIAEAWREDLHELYEQVTAPAEPDGVRVEEAILRFVEKLGQPTARDVARRIRNVTSAQAQDLMESLVRAGVLDRIEAGRTHRYRLAAEPPGAPPSGSTEVDTGAA